MTGPGLPDFFMLYGSGTNGGEIVMILTKLLGRVSETTRRRPPR
jgi:hypothetical protein